MRQRLKSIIFRGSGTVMKFMIASDIHGSAFYCRRMLERYDKENADRLILLGDILYHGPRNDLPREYDPKKVIEMLNGRAADILCVRGNCEAEVDQMVLSFPVMAEYAVWNMENRLIYITHGHNVSADNPPPLKNNDILLHGHTHVPACEERPIIAGKGNHEEPDRKESFLYMNPGSVSIPKDGTEHSYMTFENGTFLWKRLEDGEVYRCR